MFKIKALCLMVFAPTALLSMDEGILIDARTHLSNKKAALTRVYEEVTGPYQATNAEVYMQIKHTKALEKAEKEHDQALSFGVTTGLFGTAFAVTAFWPKQYSEARFFCGGFSFLAYLLSGWSLFEWRNYKAPTMTDIHNKVKAKLVRTYNGKKILEKKMGIPSWYSQPQAAQNPQNK